MIQSVTPILIYGTCNWARLLLDELADDSRFRIVAFTCDSEYFDSSEFNGYPLYEFSGIERRFSPVLPLPKETDALAEVRFFWWR